MMTRELCGVCSNLRVLGLGEGISGYYNVLLVLHILSAIIGLGSVMLNGLYLS